jgi:hypothetical protein
MEFTKLHFLKNTANISLFSDFVTYPQMFVLSLKCNETNYIYKNNLYSSITALKN